VHFGNMMP